MLKSLLFVFLITFHFSIKGQNNSVEIGEINNGVFEIKGLQTQLTKAFEWTFKDGTKITELKIENLANHYYLVASCLYQGHKRLAAIDLEVSGTKFILNNNAGFKMCSAAACMNCRFFIEKGKILACKCEETGTISNHCHYKSGTAKMFFANLQRAIKMTEKGD